MLFLFFYEFLFVLHCEFLYEFPFEFPFKALKAGFVIIKTLWVLVVFPSPSSLPASPSRSSTFLMSSLSSPSLLQTHSRLRRGPEVPAFFPDNLRDLRDLAEFAVFLIIVTDVFESCVDS